MTRGTVRIACGIVLLSAVACIPTSAQQQPAESPAAEKIHLASGMDRISGTESTSGIQYLRLVMPGTLIPATADAPKAEKSAQAPIVMVQCTRRPNGKFYFDLFTRFEGEPDLTFYPPWKPTGPNDFPPRTQKVTITMDFLGYTHVKPAKKQWEIPIETPGQYRYNQPGFGSSNMEDLSYYFQYLIALPTLRLTLDRQSAEFTMAPLLEQIRNEPMCVASRLK